MSIGLSTILSTNNEDIHDIDLDIEINYVMNIQHWYGQRQGNCVFQT